MARIDVMNERDFNGGIPNVTLANAEDDDLDAPNVDVENNLTPTNRQSQSPPSNNGSSSASDVDNLGGSLNDLVAGFDEQITACFADHTTKTDSIAPVPVRGEEDIMTDSQVWMTLTGNFGNMLPLDFNRSQVRAHQLPSLNLSDSGQVSNRDSADLDTDEELARAMDMHVMIGQSPAHAQTAEQVIDEIDEIMQGSAFSTGDHTMESVDSLYSSIKSPLCGMLGGRDADLDAKLIEAKAMTANRDNLEAMTYGKLSGLQSELDSLIQVYNEALVQELALKDELEYEKELKNAFISLLLSVQNKRRTYLADAKIGKLAPNLVNAPEPQYVSAAIPYMSGPPNNFTLQALNKILSAVNENHPGVPNMLTDYILNVLCPQGNI